MPDRPGPQGVDRATTVRRRPQVSGLFLVLTAAGLILRVLALRSNWGGLDADEATGILMAQRGAQGHLSIFFWGGNYGGAVITWVEALLVKIFGLHILIFQTVDTTLTLAIVVVFRAIASRFMRGPASDLAAGIMWMLSPNWVFWSSREYVFWLPGMLLALAMVWSCLRWHESRSPVFAYLVGILLGATYWVYPLYLTLVVVPVAFYAWAARREWRALCASIIMVPVGGVFWIIVNLRHHFESLHHPINGGQGFSLVAQHSVTQVLPSALVGISHPSGLNFALDLPGKGVLRVTGLLVITGAVVWTIACLIGRRSSLAAVGASTVLWPLVLASSGVFVDMVSYRYALVLIPVIAFMVAWVVDRVKALVFVAAAATVCGSVLAIGSGTNWFASKPACPSALQQVGRYLENVGRTKVWGSYWVSAPLDVCTADRILVSPTVVQRDQYGVERVTTARQATFVVFAGNVLDQGLASWQHRNPGVHVVRVGIGGLAVWSFSQPATPQSLQLPTSAF
jgi:hypothetical protein